MAIPSPEKYEVESHPRIVEFEHSAATATHPPGDHTVTARDTDCGQPIVFFSKAPPIRATELLKLMSSTVIGDMCLQ